MKLVITLVGRVPSKKNSRISTRSGRTFPSKQYTAWHKDASAQLIGKKAIKPNTPITFILYPPDNRKADLSNKWESIGDLLVDNHIIEDDNYYIVDDIHLLFGCVDRENPRGEIYIDE